MSLSKEKAPGHTIGTSYTVYDVSKGERFCAYFPINGSECREKCKIFSVPNCPILTSKGPKMYSLKQQLQC